MGLVMISKQVDIRPGCSMIAVTTIGRQGTSREVQAEIDASKENSNEHLHQVTHYHLAWWENKGEILA